MNVVATLIIKSYLMAMIIGTSAFTLTLTILILGMHIRRRWSRQQLARFRRQRRWWISSRHRGRLPRVRGGWFVARDGWVAGRGKVFALAGVAAPERAEILVVVLPWVNHIPEIKHYKKYILPSSTPLEASRGYLKMNSTTKFFLKNKEKKLVEPVHPPY